MAYEIREVDSSDPAMIEIINAFNRCEPEIFPELQDRHFENGHWWLVYHGVTPIAFAGLCPMEPFRGVAYFKRAWVSGDHVGHGLQLRLMFTREIRARQLGYTSIVSECAPDSHSIPNFRRAGFEMCSPEQPWGKPGAVYWVKHL